MAWQGFESKGRAAGLRWPRSEALDVRGAVVRAGCADQEGFHLCLRQRVAGSGAAGRVGAADAVEERHVLAGLLAGSELLRRRAGLGVFVELVVTVGRLALPDRRGLDAGNEGLLLGGVGAGAQPRAGGEG